MDAYRPTHGTSGSWPADGKSEKMSLLYITHDESDVLAYVPQGSRPVPMLSLAIPETTSDTSRHLNSTTAAIQPRSVEPATLTRQHAQPPGTIRPRRAPRPLYSELERMYIMYARIVCENEWNDIRQDFAERFSARSKGGLTSLYYRARSDWKLELVGSGGPDVLEGDKRVVRARLWQYDDDDLAEAGIPPYWTFQGFNEEQRRYGPQL